MSDPERDRRPARIALAVLASVLLVAVGTGLAPTAAAAATTPDGDAAGTTSSAAAAGQADQLRVCQRDAAPLVDAYNEDVEKLPGWLRWIVSDRTVIGVVTGVGGGEYTIETDGNARVESFEAGAPASPSLRVATDCETFQALADTDDETAVFQRAYWNGEIQVDGVGFPANVVVTLTELLFGIGGAISSTFGLPLVLTVTLIAGLLISVVLGVILVVVYEVYTAITGAITSAKTGASNTAESAKTGVSNTAESAKTGVSSTADSARGGVAGAVDAVRDRIAAAVEAVRDQVGGGGGGDGGGGSGGR